MTRRLSAAVLVFLLLSAQGFASDLKFHGTARLPGAKGEAKVEQAGGTTKIAMEIDEMKPASLFGGDFNTYVLWIVLPDGRFTNAGEFVLEGDDSKLQVSTTSLPSGVFVTAEPHFLVEAPSRFVVLESRGFMEGRQLDRISVAYNYERDSLAGAKEAKGFVRSELKQALTAIRLAQRAGADRFAQESWGVAQAAWKSTLALCEDSKDREEMAVQARETVRLAVAAQRLAEVRQAMAFGQQ